MTTPAEGLQRLRDAAASGELDRLGARRGVRVMTVFGSAARDERSARDLDVAVFSEPVRSSTFSGSSASSSV